MAKAVERSGGCLCGAVRYAVRGKPLWIAHCHCESCRRATSAAFATYAGFRKERFTLTSGKPAHFRSSPGVNRGICRRCGSPLTYEGAHWPSQAHVLVASLDDPAAFRPTPPEGAVTVFSRLTPAPGSPAGDQITGSADPSPANRRQCQTRACLADITGYPVLRSGESPAGSFRSRIPAI